jgi:plastocyanin
MANENPKNKRRLLIALVCAVVLAGVLVAIILIAGYWPSKDNSSADSTGSSTTAKPGQLKASDSKDKSAPQQAATSNNPQSKASAAANTVKITASGFEPATLTTHKGENVTWTNKDTSVHAIDPADKGAGGPHSPQLQPGQSYVYNFGQGGEYKYIDVMHPDRTGTVKVLANQ